MKHLVTKVRSRHKFDNFIFIEFISIFLLELEIKLCIKKSILIEGFLSHFVNGLLDQSEHFSLFLFHNVCSLHFASFREFLFFQLPFGLSMPDDRFIQWWIDQIDWFASRIHISIRRRSYIAISKPFIGISGFRWLFLNPFPFLRL